MSNQYKGTYGADVVVVHIDALAEEDDDSLWC